MPTSLTLYETECRSGFHRLMSVTYPGPTTDDYTYDAADRLTAVEGATYTWDDNGNLTDRGSDSFAWDAEYRMTSATVDSVTTTFEYNGDGLRDSRTQGSTATFTWDVSTSIPQVIDDGTLDYVYGIGRISQISSTDVTYYYLTDGLGSTVALTDSTGAVVNSYEYDIFGDVRASTGSQANEFKFTGEQVDSDTGLEYLRARYYDSATGRFMSKDPYLGIVDLPSSQNAYPYVLDNPVNLLDPSGRCVFGLGCPKEVKKAAEVVTGGARCALNTLQCSLDAANAGVTAVGGAVGLDDLCYVDLNGTACFGVCVTVGSQFSFGEGLHPYLGGGIGTPQLGGSVTVAPGQRILTGLNCGVQVSGGSPGLGPSGVVQFGSGGSSGNPKEGGSAFVEVGAGFGFSVLPFNISNTCYYVF